MNNVKITDWLRNGKQERAFSKLYALFPKVEKYILLNSGSKEEALDIFQEGLIILYQKSKDNTDLIADGFLIKSCQFLWHNELRKKKVRGNGSFESQLRSSTTKNSKIDNLIQDDSELELLIEKENKLIQVEEIVRQISKKCREIFELFYFKSMIMTEIAKNIGYKSVQSAKVQKYKCMEQARNLALATDNINTNVSSSV
jgi:RNA polymerase sigma factor (sigma-70 family)